MKKNNLQIRIKGTKVININESSNLLYEIENGQITYEEALKRIGNIHNNINKIIKMQSLNSNQINLLNILFMVNEIFTGESESVGVNKKTILRFLKKNQTKKSKNLMNNQILQICPN